MKRKRPSAWLLILTALLTPTLASSQTQPATAAPAAQTSASPQLVVPVNTTIPLELKNSINSRTAYAGQAIYCETIYPITVNNRIVIPVGTYVKGSITQAVRPGRVKGKAQLGLRFDSITLPDGTTRPLRATLSGYAGNGKEGFSRAESKVEGESSKGQDLETVAVTAAEGAGIGSIAGISKGRTGTGAVVGGAAGALGGLIYVLATRGKDIVLPPGTNLELQITSPLSFYSDEVESSPELPSSPALPHRDPGPGM